MINELSLIASIADLATKTINDKTGAYIDEENVKKSYNLLKEYASGPSSISRKAKQSIYEYPLLISSNISNINSICKIMKHLEVDISNMLMVAMGINPSTKSDKNLEIQRYLSNYHTNGADYSFQVESARLLETRNLNDAAYRKSITTEAVAGGRVAGSPDHELGLVTFSSKTIGEKYASVYNMTVIEIKVRLDDDKTSEIKIPIGIRTTPYHLNSPDLRYILESFLKTRNTSGLVRFIQWRSGEIKSLKNLLFRYDEIKRDIEYDRRIGTNNSWLKVLKSRGNNRKVNLLGNALGNAFGKDLKMSSILPNCIIALNLDDIRDLSEVTGVDIFEKPAAASKLLDDAMALAMVILDESTDVAHIMYSGESKFVGVPLSQMTKDKDADMTKVFLDLLKRVA